LEGRESARRGGLSAASRPRSPSPGALDELTATTSRHQPGGSLLRVTSCRSSLGPRRSTSSAPAHRPPPTAGVVPTSPPVGRWRAGRRSDRVRRSSRTARSPAACGGCYAP